MKRIIFYTILILFLFNNNIYAQSDELVNVCALDIGNATYLKDFKVKLQQSSVKPSPSTKFSVLLNKGTIYQLNVCDAAGYEGKAVLMLFDHSKLLGSNQKGDGTLMKAFGFQCQKTGVYNISVSFKNGKQGAAVTILSYMNVK
ncbi:MAG: hypothetical protein KAG95_02150 [Bacteroidales bacterium]|nr:hypothetical protein [Bacteroidales bacterium]